MMREQKRVCCSNSYGHPSVSVEEHTGTNLRDFNADAGGTTKLLKH